MIHFAPQKIFAIGLQHHQMNLDKHTLTPIENAMRTTAIYFGIIILVNTAVKMNVTTN
jgi:hypothetical protein